MNLKACVTFPVNTSLYSPSPARDSLRPVGYVTHLISATLKMIGKTRPPRQFGFLCTVDEEPCGRGIGGKAQHADDDQHCGHNRPRFVASRCWQS